MPVLKSISAIRSCSSTTAAPGRASRTKQTRGSPVRANREIATLSHVFNMAREWGITTKDNPCQGVRKNREKPRDYYANDVVWAAVYSKAPQELKDAMDLAYLTGQRPADVLMMRKDDVEGGYLLVQQNKTGKRLRIRVNSDGEANSLGKLLHQIAERNSKLVTSYLIVSKTGRRMTATMLRKRWDEARKSARLKATNDGDVALAKRIAEFQFRDIRPKAASEIEDIAEASILLGHTKGDITERVYRRIGAIAQPSK
ncbi:tyrosine-type recombinase/integrase [Pseudomonas paraversuta]|uniref:tyrosine-type recombinase/integrase n=1 Tax=Pseudomonas paraversuta TaxID=2750624 RepID=UPI0039A6FAFA